MINFENLEFFTKNELLLLTMPVKLYIIEKRTYHHVLFYALAGIRVRPLHACLQVVIA